MSAFVLDASYTLTWCFPDRATVDTDAALRRMESNADEALVPWIWQIEVCNAIGKAVVRKKLDEARALAIWNELLALPIRQVAIGNTPHLLRLAVKHNLSVYDTCYLNLAMTTGLPLATNDDRLRQTAESYGLAAITP